MTRKVICVLLRLALRVFFRRIEVAGLERVPRGSPLIFVLNHPNGLVDPAFILCLTPRRVSFLAKAPLFRMPIIGYLVRALDSLPVYRRQDEGEDTTRNRETFELARSLLARGGTLAICPEGVSHDEPGLRPLKTGAARIALGAASSGEVLDLKIVPVGLYYTSKTSFRSAALLYFGAPLTVEPVALGPDGEPAREAVRALSDRIESALREVILNAEHEEALTTIARAERIFSSVDQVTGEELSLTRELKLRRRFVEGYALLRARSPERLTALDARIRRYEEELKQAGVDPQDLSAPLSTKLSIAGHLASRSILFLCLFPFALAGALAHYPAYRLAGYFATRFALDAEDVVSTIKIIAAMLLFPLTWIVWALLFYALAGWPAALAALLLTPLNGYAAVRVFEELDQFIGGARALAYFIMQRRFFLQLLAERNAIRKEILALGEEAAAAHE
ncbi:MAG TPA: lysophospholipid acyltransferase family protein [Pyrinomonadaceae bacterium]|nr:lysophospholipid acyltransferase family protein [Pyrinomonadaceae bacterium]